MARAIISQNISEAAAYLQQGEVIGIPTETVYGLAGNALNEKAIVKIFEVKNRPAFDPLIVHTCEIREVTKYVETVPDWAIQLFEKFSPGPLTLLLPKKSIIPDLVTSGLENVGIRIPNHPLTLELLRNIPFPLAAPSANPFGYISPVSAFHVQDQLGDKIPLILDGGFSSVGIESTIVGYESGKPVIYRLGGIPLEAIEEITGKIEVRRSSSAPAAPGMLISHYAPGKPFFIADSKEAEKLGKGKKWRFIQFKGEKQFEQSVVLSAAGSFTEAAANLFKVMRQLDQTELDIIFAELLPEAGLGRAINDRLRRAAAIPH